MRKTSLLAVALFLQKQFKDVKKAPMLRRHSALDALLSKRIVERASEKRRHSAPAAVDPDHHQEQQQQQEPFQAVDPDHHQEQQQEQQQQEQQEQNRRQQKRTGSPWVDALLLVGFVFSPQSITCKAPQRSIKELNKASRAFAAAVNKKQQPLDHHHQQQQQEEEQKNKGWPWVDPILLTCWLLTPPGVDDLFIGFCGARNCDVVRCRAMSCDEKLLRFDRKGAE
ncbi:unnamed protein product [Vitrella brassicaformis CCMP3155]|uniref:Uncharacterized protein n=1 Tax=Vitrella brassicaformis (strain CCMP3155) TaxID=1169540 RepID=A0A0G4FVK2_VITBC|nr:unnamed protein product [Vitrella brassicaformis CCMP3155]|eukprot:CEM18571.1 unnamed protein product [Vitrella brassicaformis CCMP3155]